MLHDRWIAGRRSPTFTLQWHVTDACELSCRHCYRDPSNGTRPGGPSLAEALGVLDGLVSFCRRRSVRGQVCLTGGNPFLHPGFHEIYAGAAARGLPVSILGNPVPRDWLLRAIEVVPPVSYQVSLEGLPETNDAIRGPGHFERTEKFLALLGELGVPSVVMLTLHAGNLGEVLPLARRLRGLARRFAFNRLSQVGGGETMEMPSRREYAAFLRDYLRAAREERHLATKENLLALAWDGDGGPRRPRGCTGYGCGAAFNFLALLPDGELHACRKFPSPVGHLAMQSLDEAWSSPEAARYRSGSDGCRWCHLRNRCGGCLAVAHGAGLSPLADRDPHCFAAERRLLPALGAIRR